MGGDKDTSRPILISVSNKVKDNQQRISIEFSENIQTKNTLVVSPINKQATNQTTSTTHNNHILITTASNTNTIYLNGYVYDLNENNPITQPAVLLKTDTGELIVTLPYEDIKVKKRVFIRDINRYAYQKRPSDTSLIYLPNTLDNRTFHFHGLTDSLHVVYVIYDDDNYTVTKNEKAACHYITNNFTDTFHITPPPKTKKYKNAFNFRDSLYMITEPTIDINWFNKNVIHYYYKDSLYILKENINLISDALSIDSFITIKKVVSYQNNNNYYYTLNNISDTMAVSIYTHYPFSVENSVIKRNTKSNLIKTGMMILSNPNLFTINTSITIGMSQLFISLPPNSKEQFYLPEGGYGYFSWIPNTNQTVTLSPNTIDYKIQLPLSEIDLIYKPEKQMVVSSKLENTLILPDITAFNTGTTSK